MQDDSKYISSLILTEEAIAKSRAEQHRLVDEMHDKMLFGLPKIKIHKSNAYEYRFEWLGSRKSLIFLKETLNDGFILKTSWKYFYPRFTKTEIIVGELIWLKEQNLLAHLLDELEMMGLFISSPEPNIRIAMNFLLGKDKTPIDPEVLRRLKKKPLGKRATKILDMKILDPIKRIEGI